MNSQPDYLFEEKPRSTFPITLVVFGAASAAAIYFSSQGDYGTASAVVLLGVALRSGYRAGASTFLGLFAGCALAMVAALPLGLLIEPLLEEQLGTQGLANRLLSVSGARASLVLIVTLVVRFCLRRLVRNQPQLQSCDRWLGLACGGAQGALLFLILAGGVMIVEPLARDELLARPPQDRSMARRVSEQVVMAAESTRTGAIGPFVSAYNPFEHIVALKSLQHGVEVLRSPETLSAVATHPAMEEFCERPAFQETWQQLSNDPELSEVMSSDQPITRETLASLMQNPAILKLFDDPDFVSGLKDVLGEIDPQTLLSSTSVR